MCGGKVRRGGGNRGGMFGFRNDISGIRGRTMKDDVDDKYREFIRWGK